jgi:hypothetical protein
MPGQAWWASTRCPEPTSYWESCLALRGLEHSDGDSSGLTMCQPSAGPTGHIVNSSSVPSVRLSLIAEDLVVARLAATAPVPSELFAASAPVVSVTRTGSELSIVCPAALAPAGAEIDGPWSAWYIQGPIPFGLTGVVQAVVSPLSTRGIPVFVVSTFDSDVIMAPADQAANAASALIEAGHEIN